MATAKRISEINKSNFQLLQSDAQFTVVDGPPGGPYQNVNVLATNLFNEIRDGLLGEDSRLLSYSRGVSTNTSIQQSDINHWIKCTNSSGNDIVITAGSGFQVGSQVVIDRIGAGEVAITAPAGLIGKEVDTNQTVKILAKFDVIHLWHTGADVWRVTGSMKAP